MEKNNQSINQSNNLEMDKQTNKSINFQKMVVSYFLSNMNSHHDLCLVGTKNIFFARPKSSAFRKICTVNWNALFIADAS